MSCLSLEERTEAIEEARKEGATHLLIVCDTFSHEDYTVPVRAGELAEKKAEFDGPNMQRIHETIVVQSDMEARLAEVNEMLREIEEDYRCCLLASSSRDGLTIRYAMTKKGTLIRPKKLAKK